MRTWEELLVAVIVPPVYTGLDEITRDGIQNPKSLFCAKMHSKKLKCYLTFDLYEEECVIIYFKSQIVLL